MDIVAIEDLSFGWQPARPVLAIPEFRVAQGERVFLAGPSGSGKSSLLAVIAGIAAAQSGRLEIMGQDMSALSSAGRDAFRADHLGVIFQLFNLVPYLSPIENVLLACRFSPARRKRASADVSLQAEAERLLNALGLSGDSLKRASTELSVGQQQRVAAARALIGSPALIIADEPTSALDADSRDSFIGLLQAECARAGSALLFVSHDRELGQYFDRQLDLAELNGAREVDA